MAPCVLYLKLPFGTATHWYRRDILQATIARDAAVLVRKLVARVARRCIERMHDVQYAER